jgi:hypothetical protein
VPDERPEGLQTSRLREGCERKNGFFGFHISRFMEILGEVNPEIRAAPYRLY